MRRGDPRLDVWPVTIQALSRRVGRIEAAIWRAQTLGHAHTMQDLRAQLVATTAELEAAKMATLASEGPRPRAASGIDEHRPAGAR